MMRGKSPLSEFFRDNKVKQLLFLRGFGKGDNFIFVQKFILLYFSRKSKK